MLNSFIMAATALVLVGFFAYLAWDAYNDRHKH